MNDAKSKVSVVIPAMGFAQSVGVLLDALVNQEYPPDEVIIVDSSNDNSVSEIANNFRKKLKINFVKVDRAYPGEARNIGVKNATNDLLAFLDSKTIPNSTWLKKGIKELTVNSYDIIFGSTLYIAKANKQRVLQACTYGKEPVITTPGTILKKKVFQIIGEFIEGVRTSDDLEWRNRAEDLSFKILKPTEFNLTYSEISSTFLQEFKRHFIYQFHGAKIDAQLNTKIIILGLGLLLLTLIIPQWNRLVGWEESVLYIPHITKSYFYFLSIFAVFILGSSKFFKYNNLLRKYLLVLAFIACSYVVYRWNFVMASWVEESIYYIPHITKSYILILVLGSLIFRGVYTPLCKGVEKDYLFPFRWFWVGTIGSILDIVKVPGYLLGAIMALKRIF